MGNLRNRDAPSSAILRRPKSAQIRGSAAFFKSVLLSPTYSKPSFNFEGQCCMKAPTRPSWAFKTSEYPIRKSSQ
jgi:hypothetical protein